MISLTHGISLSPLADFCMRALTSGCHALHTPGVLTRNKSKSVIQQMRGQQTLLRDQRNKNAEALQTL